MNYIFFTVFLSFISATLSKSITNRQSAIVGGIIARGPQFPFAVYLEFNKEFLCTSTIISTEHILTAAHCLHNPYYKILPSYNNLKVVSGTNSLTGVKQIHDVSKIFFHPKFKFSESLLSYDIGLIKLKKPMIFNSKQKAIELPVGPPINGRPAVLIGWGATKNSGDVSNSLRFMNTKIIDGKTCSKKMPGGGIDESELCEDTPLGHGSCFGDSGGPLISEGRIVGVVSTGSGNCGEGYSDVFSNVFYYKPLILQWMKAK